MENHKAGYVAIIGLPNAGKSTLLNTILGQKLTITSPKPQTTRKKILGILSEENYQIIFIDTPGILKPSYLLQEKMLKYIDSVANSLDDTQREEKVRRLYQYLSANKEGLIPINKRELQLPRLNDSLEYRGMGICEHNVYLAVAKRLKHRCAAWSPEGSLNLCKLLCLKVGHKLSEGLEEITRITLPEKFTEKITTNILSAAKIKDKVGKGYEGKHCPMPFENAAVTNGRVAIRKMLSLS